MTLVHHVGHLVLRRPGRALAAGLGAAMAAALLTAIILFGAASGATVTQRALAGVPVDAQVVLTAGADPASAQRIVDAERAVSAVMPVDVVHFDSASLQKAGSATQTSAGLLVGVDPGYLDATGLFRVNSGRQVPGQVVVSRDLATNVGAQPGDSIAFALPGGASVDLVVSGVVDITGADQVLGPTDAAHRAAGFNPPTNVAVLDLATLVAAVEPRIAAGTMATGQDGAAGTTGGPVATAEPAVLHELHLRYDHQALPGDPVSAQAWLDGVRRRLELAGAGAFTVADDASASLAPIAGDLAWGQILFVFLGLPGIVLALVLARLSSQAEAAELRRHVSMLRARGASGRQLAGVLVGAETLVALVGSLLGAVVGVLLAAVLFGGELATVDPVARIALTVALVIPATTLLAVLAAAGALRGLVTRSVTTGRQEIQRTSAPLWQRVWLDVGMLIAGTLAYIWLSGGGVHPAITTEGNPTVTLAVTSFLAPLLLWLGGSLLLLRVAGLAVRRSGRLAALLERLLGPGGGLAAPSLAARAPVASRLLVLIALSLSFAVSVAMFDSTYRQQQRVDAELTLGADLKAVPVAPSNTDAVAAVRAAGVSAATPFVQKVVYVGPEAQDLLAIDPATLPAVSPLGDGFFQGTTAAAAMDALRSTTDGVLVSSETATDYSLVPGDHLRIMVPDSTGKLREVVFQMVGVALEFPTAPRDAFLVANQAYVAQQVSDPRISFVLGRTSGDAASAAVATSLGDGWRVEDLRTVTARLANTITSVDLQALVIIDLLFAVLIASLGAAMSILAGVADRARELAALQAVGAEPSHLRALLAGEVGTLGAAGILAGALTGVLVGVALLTILSGIFDPPADLPAMPWGIILLVVAATAVGLAGAMAIASRRALRMSVLGELRDG
jgi:putative ABC transport system permease protein